MGPHEARDLLGTAGKAVAAPSNGSSAGALRTARICVHSFPEPVSVRTEEDSSVAQDFAASCYRVSRVGAVGWWGSFRVQVSRLPYGIPRTGVCKVLSGLVA